MNSSSFACGRIHNLFWSVEPSKPVFFVLITYIFIWMSVDNRRVPWIFPIRLISECQISKSLGHQIRRLTTSGRHCKNMNSKPFVRPPTTTMGPLPPVKRWSLFRFFGYQRCWVVRILFSQSVSDMLLELKAASCQRSRLISRYSKVSSISSLTYQDGNHSDPVRVVEDTSRFREDWEFEQRKNFGCAIIEDAFLRFETSHSSSSLRYTVISQLDCF